MLERGLALALLAASGVYLAHALGLSPGTAARPGPGFFPRWVGMFGTTVALAWVALSLRRPTPSAPVSREGLRRVLATLAALAGFCLLLPWAGYPLTAFFFVAGLVRRLGAGWPGALAVALAAALASYALFALLLGVPLPRGALVG